MNASFEIYLCQNCNKEFKLAETDEKRCPHCFWTTSLKLIHGTSMPPKPAPIKSTAPQASSTWTKVKIPFKTLLLILLGAGLFFLVRLIPKHEFIQLSLPAANQTPTALTKTEVPAAISPTNLPETIWTDEQKSVLEKRIEIKLPRAISKDEKEILMRRVNFAMDMHELPKLNFMTEDDFDHLLTKAQQDRKIYFSGKYKRELKDLFKEHYQMAQAAFVAGRIEEARAQLLESIVFPIYRNDILLHRSVAQVMLRPYINDVLAKMQGLNAFVLHQSLAQGMETLAKDYEHLFVLIDQQAWDEAYQMAKRLTEEANSIEVKKNQFQVPYPPVLSKIDQDIRKGLEWQDESLAPISSSINSVLADLRIKTETLEKNTTEAIQSVLSVYQTAIQAMEAKKWAEAIKQLSQIQYPIELVQDAHAKLAVLQTAIQS